MVMSILSGFSTVRVGIHLLKPKLYLASMVSEWTSSWRNSGGFSCGSLRRISGPTTRSNRQQIFRESSHSATKTLHLFAINMSDDSLHATASSASSLESKLSRSEIFNRYLDQKDNQDSVFQLSAMHFTKFDCSHISFYFKPSDIVDNVVENVRFECKLTFDGKYWLIKRDSFPVQCKWPIYRLFWNKLYLDVTDENIIDVIEMIHTILRRWSFRENQRRFEKFLEYCEGNSDIELDEDDEILYLTEEQRIQLQETRWTIMKRMIPPEKYDIRKHLGNV